MQMIPQSHDENRWLAFRRPMPAARMRLFCFPYSGADASVFASWQNSFPDHIEVCPVQLPGRGRRLAEPFSPTFDSLITKLADALYADLSEMPFALFGHSLGGLVCFELARHLLLHEGCMPQHLFVSGCSAADRIASREAIHELPDESFVAALRSMNASLAQLLNQRELRDIFVPILRADFRLFETYTYREESPLPFPITAFGGLDDSSVQIENLRAWRRHTDRRFRLHMLPGDHLFVNGTRSELIRLLAEELGSSQSAGAA